MEFGNVIQKKLVFSTTNSCPFKVKVVLLGRQKSFTYGVL
jgi:hypothetical protein